MHSSAEERVEWIRLHAGDTLFAEGDKGEDLFFVLGGRLRAVSADGRVLNEMTRGESIGEIRIADRRTVRTRAWLPSATATWLRVSRRAFDEIVSKYPAVM